MFLYKNRITKIENSRFYKISVQQDTINWTVLQTNDNLPINGLSDVIGIISDTVFRKIVKDSRIVTPETFTTSFITDIL